MDANLKLRCKIFGFRLLATKCQQNSELASSLLLPRQTAYNPPSGRQP